MAKFVGQHEATVVLHEAKRFANVQRDRLRVYTTRTKRTRRSGRQAGTQTDTHTDRHTHRQTQTDRHTQTDTHTHTDTLTQTHTHICIAYVLILGSVRGWYRLNSI